MTGADHSADSVFSCQFILLHTAMVGSTPHATRSTSKKVLTNGNYEVPFAPGEMVEVIIKSGAHKGNFVKGKLSGRGAKPDYFHIYILPTDMYDCAGGHAGSTLQNIHLSDFRRIPQPNDKFAQGEKAQVEILNGDLAGFYLLCTIIGPSGRPHHYDIKVEDTNDDLLSAGNKGKTLRNVSEEHLRKFRPPQTRLQPHSCLPLPKGYDTKAIAIGKEVSVTKLEQKLQFAVQGSGMTWPSGPSHKDWREKLGKKGVVEHIDEIDMTVYLSEGVGWVPIRALFIEK
mmetsp:Transcript_94903/g.174584  ORF Transcript_94903/g.174584 Transcript_94903/m.174584 type:complete len:285 (-) Transcript_94903:156-1010(-)